MTALQSDITEMIGALLKREKEVPEQGSEFRVEEKRANRGSRDLFIEYFILRIKPALEEAEVKRRVEAVAIGPDGDHDGPRSMVVCLSHGTNTEIFEFLRDPGIVQDAENVFRRLSNHLRSTDGEHPGGDW